MHHAEDNGLLNSGIYGNRANQDAKQPPFIEEMIVEISRFSRKHLIKFDNDMTSCYNQIIASIVSIVSCKYGLHWSATYVCAWNLQDAKYKLKTQLGVSDDFYQHCKTHPIYGTSQGSTNSPAIWCFICSMLFDCFELKAHGAIFESPDQQLQIQIFMVGFVDDTTNGTNSFCENIQPPIDSLVKQMQEDAQLWNVLLYTSGSALELPKCTYQILDWSFVSSGAPVLAGRPEEGFPPISLQYTDSRKMEAIKSLSPHSSHKTLGY